MRAILKLTYIVHGEARTEAFTADNFAGVIDLMYNFIRTRPLIADADFTVEYRQ